MTIILRHIPMSETRQILNKNDPTCQEMQYILNASDQINTKSRMHSCKIKLFLIQFSLFITKKFTHSTYEHKVIFILSKADKVIPSIWQAYFSKYQFFNPKMTELNFILWFSSWPNPEFDIAIYPKRCGQIHSSHDFLLINKVKVRLVTSFGLS